jgi:hypothetical protein
MGGSARFGCQATAVTFGRARRWTGFDVGIESATGKDTAAVALDTSAHL